MARWFELSINFDQPHSPICFRLDTQDKWVATPFRAGQFFTGDIDADSDKAWLKVAIWLTDQGYAGPDEG